MFTSLVFFFNLAGVFLQLKAFKCDKVNFSDTACYFHDLVCRRLIVVCLKIDIMNVINYPNSTEVSRSVLARKKKKPFLDSYDVAVLLLS